MKFQLVSLLLTLFCSSSKAQYLISLKDEEIDLKDSHFEVVEWIDWRKDLFGGWIDNQGTLIKTREPVKFTDSLISEIESMLNFSSSENKLAIRLRGLSIADFKTTAAPVIMANISAEVFLVRDNFYEYLDTYSITNQKKAYDVRYEQVSNIREVFTKFFSIIDLGVKFPKDYILTPEEFRTKEIKLDINSSQLFVTGAKDGIYYTTREYLNAIPRNQLEFKKLVTKENELIIKKISNDQKNILNDSWAIVYDGNTYIHYGDKFLRLENRNTTFRFMGPRYTDTESITSGAFLFGITGAIMIHKATKQRWVYELDLRTGVIKPIKRFE